LQDDSPTRRTTSLCHGVCERVVTGCDESMTGSVATRFTAALQIGM
jgi:hypothetical protein